MKNTNIKIDKLPETFMGRAEVKGFTFTKLEAIAAGFIFRVDTGTGHHYEVFKYKLTPICLDFVTRDYSDDHFKEHYPKKSAFGVWAWTCMSLELAEKKLKLIKELYNAGLNGKS